MPTEVESQYHYFFTYEEVKDALTRALMRQDFDALADIIDHDISSLTQAQHSKTPIFNAMEELLHKRRETNKGYRHAVVGIAVEVLGYILTEAERKLAPETTDDRSVFEAFVHNAFNHICHTSMRKTGGTVRDLIEDYAEVNVTERPLNGRYADLHELVHEYGLEKKKILYEERLKTEEARKLRDR